MSEELKPGSCPFCGSDAELWHVYDVPRVGCSNSACIVAFDDAGVDVKSWNTRHTAEIKARAIEEFCKWMPEDYEEAKFQEGVDHIKALGRSYANLVCKQANKGR